MPLLSRSHLKPPQPRSDFRVSLSRSTAERLARAALCVCAFGFSEREALTVKQSFGVKPPRAALRATPPARFESKRLFARMSDQETAETKCDVTFPQESQRSADWLCCKRWFTRSRWRLERCLSEDFYHTGMKHFLKSVTSNKKPLLFWGNFSLSSFECMQMALNVEKYESSYSLLPVFWMWFKPLNMCRLFNFLLNKCLHQGAPSLAELGSTLWRHLQRRRSKTQWYWWRFSLQTQILGRFNHTGLYSLGSS